MRPTTLADHRARMERVVDHLRGHLDAPIDIAELARIGGLSARQFERVFARIVGESPRAHARRLRLERAAKRLRSTREPILTLALEAGFQSHAAFTRLFRRSFGQSPAAYRGAPHVTAQPRDRAKLWQVVIAGGLRRHVEGGA